ERWLHLEKIISKQKKTRRTAVLTNTLQWKVSRPAARWNIFTRLSMTLPSGAVKSCRATTSKTMFHLTSTRLVISSSEPNHTMDWRRQLRILLSKTQSTGHFIQIKFHRCAQNNFPLTPPTF